MACDLHDSLWFACELHVMLAFYVMHVFQVCCMWLACDPSFLGHVVCMWYWSELGGAHNLIAAGLLLSSSLTRGTFIPPSMMTTTSQLTLSHTCYCTHCHTLTLCMFKSVQWITRCITIKVLASKSQDTEMYNHKGYIMTIHASRIRVMHELHEMLMGSPEHC